MSLYIITDLFKGALFSTKDETKAHEFAACEDYFVYSVETNEWLTTEESGEIVRSKVESLD